MLVFLDPDPHNPLNPELAQIRIRKTEENSKGTEDSFRLLPYTFRKRLIFFSLSSCLVIRVDVRKIIIPKNLVTN